MTTPAPARVFRSAPVPAVCLFDAHVNAVPEGIAPPDSFYASVSLNELLASRRADADAGITHAGGLVAAPAGTDLLSASLALAEQLPDPRGGWRAALRFDGGRGAFPRADPVRGFFARRRSAWGSGGRVAAAIRRDPTLLNRFAAVKLMPQQTGLPEPDVLRAVSDAGLPLLVHAGARCTPQFVKRQLLPHVGSPVILAHLGSWPCAADTLDDAVQLAADDPRVHLETSGASIGNFVRFAVEAVPDKVLFGTNTPMCTPAVQWKHVAGAIDRDVTLRKVAIGNAARLFGLSAEGGAS